MTEVRVVSDRAAAGALSGEWDALAAACGAGFAARPAYGLSWWDATGTGRLHVVTVRRADALVAVAALHRRRLAGRWVLRWLGHGLGTVGEVLAVDDDAARALWAALAAGGEPLQLTHVRPDAPAVLALRRDPSWQVRIEVDDRCPVMSVPAEGGAGALRSSSSLRRLRQLGRAAVRAHGSFDVEVVDDLAGLERRWSDVVRVAALADADSGRLDLCAAPWNAFTLPFLRAEAAAGRLLVVGLLVGGRWSAHVVTLGRAPLLQLWLTRFDPAVGTTHPGHQLLMWLADHAAERGVQRVDQLIGQNAYKLAWSRDEGYDVATLLALPRSAGPLGVVAAHLGAARAAGELARAGAARLRERR